MPGFRRYVNNFPANLRLRNHQLNYQHALSHSSIALIHLCVVVYVKAAVLTKLLQNQSNK